MTPVGMRKEGLCNPGPMSVSLEGNPGCSALGHLYRSDGDRRVCITCGYVKGSDDTTT